MAGLNEAEVRVDDGLMNLDFNRICRLCLNFCREFVDLRPSNGTPNEPRHIIDQIKYCYNIKIDLTEPLPSKICLQCIQILTLLSATKRNIKYSEMMLKNILSIRNAHHVINTQAWQGVSHTGFQRLLTDNHPRQQEPPAAYERPAGDNNPLENLRINPIHITTMQELYRIQDQGMRNRANQNFPTNQNLNRTKEEKREKKNVVHSKKKTENTRVEENEPVQLKSTLLKSVGLKQNVSSGTNSISVKPSPDGPSCSTIPDIKPPVKNFGKISKIIEEGKTKSTNKKPNVVNNINKKKPIEIDLKRELKVKLEILDLKNTKLYCPPSTDGSSKSTEGSGVGTSGESRSGKMVKEIGTDIDKSNILSPKVKRMRKSIKSIPKG